MYYTHVTQNGDLMWTIVNCVIFHSIVLCCCIALMLLVVQRMTDKDIFQDCSHTLHVQSEQFVEFLFPPSSSPANHTAF